ncbi:MAG: phosphoribosylformylglycinamidine synthase subunit PurS [Methanocellales archaeon]|nr:phosphoribosylformylglycinamidine synthase subunit PurS [Methanocellales archaeon]MDD3291973.1 phosphoribosylformylglycinamidine synthase subunit PurS [Methanocellales archaeon]MDD5235625.1 phosphoribosylformylglycinamidine synthase subunit PurS [Methanocellales archaeon]MDD5485472.1 phosphoribosylformylglycinamidine synthase subunit PurS [Methanocellales archaeon]
MEADVTISLNKGVADPEGSNVKKALNLLGFDEVMNVRTMKTFRIDLATTDRVKAKKDIEEMCKKLLANPVIQSYQIELR